MKTVLESTLMSPTLSMSTTSLMSPTLSKDNTKLGLPQPLEILDEIEYMEFDKEIYQECGMFTDNMESVNCEY